MSNGNSEVVRQKSIPWTMSVLKRDDGVVEINLQSLASDIHTKWHASFHQPLRDLGVWRQGEDGHVTKEAGLECPTVPEIMEKLFHLFTCVNEQRFEALKEKSGQELGGLAKRLGIDKKEHKISMADVQ